MKRRRFGTTGRFQEACTATLETISGKANRDEFDAWKSRWTRCIDTKGGYLKTF